MFELMVLLLLLLLVTAEFRVFSEKTDVGVLVHLKSGTVSPDSHPFPLLIVILSEITSESLIPVSRNLLCFRVCSFAVCNGRSHSLHKIARSCWQNKSALFSCIQKKQKKKKQISAQYVIKKCSTGVQLSKTCDQITWQMSQTGNWEEEGWRREKRWCFEASLLAWWTLSSHTSQRAASSAEQNTEASFLLQTSHWIFIFSSQNRLIFPFSFWILFNEWFQIWWDKFLNTESWIWNGRKGRKWWALQRL